MLHSIILTEVELVVNCRRYVGEDCKVFKWDHPDVVSYGLISFHKWEVGSLENHDDHDPTDHRRYDHHENGT